MSDATSLRSLLTRVDATAPAIQSSASAMMKHYDRSAEVAVLEWRNALHNSQREQWLPLLYVANEVLQTSKRNRGNKFLEAFSPILGQSLMFVCQHSDGSVVEKIRRTVKIWADRRVFSVRYVNELLQGLEPYRNNRGSTTPTAAASTASTDGASFSPSSMPATTTPSPHLSTTNHAGTTATNTTTPATTSTQQQQDEDSDDPMDIFNNNDEDQDDKDSDDDDDDVFGASDGGAKLDVEIDFDASALNSPKSTAQRANNSNNNNSGLKRRRSSIASAGSQQSQHKKKRKAALSTTALSELWKQVSSLQQSFDHSTAMLRDIQLPSTEQLDNLVGDELLEHYQTIVAHQERVQQERQTLHSIATERRTLEQEAVRYIPWLEAALEQDAEDIRFCQALEQSVQSFLRVHPAIQSARDARVQEELRLRRQQEEQERKRKQEEESKKFREAALSKETEAKPGMVWNKVTQEYQYLNTDESWRD